MKRLLSAVALGFSLVQASAAFAGPQVKIAYDVQETKIESEKLDILFVIDDSGSMEMYQESLRLATQRFAAAFDSLQGDVHAAVTTTSMSYKNYCQSKALCDGKFKDGYISNRSGVRFSDELAARLKVGTQGDATETVFEPLLTALEEPLRNPENAGFLRADARLVIVFVTDAEEQSRIKPTEFVQRVLALKGGNADLVSIIGTLLPSGQRPPASCTRDQDEPILLEESLKLLKGTLIDLCSVSMGDEVAKAVLALDRPGKKAVTVDVRSFKLPALPILSSMKITYGDQQLAAGDILGGWVYRSNSNKVLVGEQFDYSTQPAGTKLEVEFDAAAWPTYKR